MQRSLPATRAATLLGDFDRRPAYRGLAEAMRRLVVDGRVPPGVRLPSERDLTAALDVSRTTVAAAYAQLREQGYLVSRRGSGSITALPGGHGHRSDHLLEPGGSSPDRLDLTCAALPAATGTAATFEAVVTDLPASLTGSGYHPSGHPALQEVLAERYAARGLPTEPHQVVVTTGALAAVAVVARALGSAGDRVVVENPTYPNAIAALQRSGLRVAGLPVDPDGWDLDAAVGAIRQVAPRLAYLIPDFHNPTGCLLPDEGRARLGAALDARRVTAVVDESLVDLAHSATPEGAPMPAPFASHARDVVTVGSASKLLWGGLRVGWARVPERYVEAVIAARLSLDLGAPVVEQQVTARLLADDRTLVLDRRAELTTARQTLVDALAAELPDWQVRPPAGGLSVWCRLPAPRAADLAGAALRHDVAVATGPNFAPEGGLDSFVRLPFVLSPDDLRTAVGRLAQAWEEVRAAPTSPPDRTARPTLVA